MASDSAGCIPFVVDFQRIYPYPSSLLYSWDFAEGLHSTDSTPKVTFTEAGVFVPHLQIISPSGCIDTVDYTLEYPIVAHEIPKVNFKVNTLDVGIDEPSVQVTSLLLNNDLMHFEIEGGFETTDSTFNYRFPDSDEYSIFQINVSGFGCSDTMELKVVVGGFTAYIPNSFTPDGDGYNELFVPVVSNCVSFDFRIYDRWGIELFKSVVKGEGWDGTSNQKQCPESLYNFTLELLDFDKNPHFFRGAVNLIR